MACIQLHPLDIPDLFFDPGSGCGIPALFRAGFTADGDPPNTRAQSPPILRSCSSSETLSSFVDQRRQECHARVAEVQPDGPEQARARELEAVFINLGKGDQVRVREMAENAIDCLLGQADKWEAGDTVGRLGFWVQKVTRHMKGIVGGLVVDREYWVNVVTFLSPVDGNL